MVSKLWKQKSELLSTRLITSAAECIWGKEEVGML